MEKCKDCDGTGRVPMDGKELPCLWCNGTGQAMTIKELEAAQDEEQLHRASKFFSRVFLFLGFAFAALAALPALRKLITGSTNSVLDGIGDKLKQVTREEKEIE